MQLLVHTLIIIPWFAKCLTIGKYVVWHIVISSGDV